MSKMLWMIAEVGEAAQVIKKQGSDEIMQNSEVRKDFVEEMCDVLMYFNDVLISYSITPEEFERAYTEKHNKNMKRW
jgi:NTP pyrophosphatase (non-canonical NTP hydrolase)